MTEKPIKDRATAIGAAPEAVAAWETEGGPEAAAEPAMEREGPSCAVKVSTSDMAYFLIRHTYTSLSGIPGLVISFGALFLLFWLDFGPEDRVQQIALVVAACLFTVVNPLLLWFKAFQQVKLTPAFQEPLTYVFGREAIYIRQGELEDAVGWEQVQKVLDTKKRLIIYVSAVRAFILPKAELGRALPAVLAVLEEKVGPGGKKT